MDVHFPESHSKKLTASCLQNSNNLATAVAKATMTAVNSSKIPSAILLTPSFKFPFKMSAMPSRISDTPFSTEITARITISNALFTTYCTIGDSQIRFSASSIVVIASPTCVSTSCKPLGSLTWLTPLKSGTAAPPPPPPPLELSFDSQRFISSSPESCRFAFSAASPAADVALACWYSALAFACACDAVWPKIAPNTDEITAVSFASHDSSVRMAGRTKL